MHEVIEQDLDYIWNALSESEKSYLRGRTFVITGLGVKASQLSSNI